MIPPHQPLAFQTADGLTLRGAVYGAGTHEIVFTHGNGLPAQCYAPAFVPLLSQARLYGLNARGHGGSDIPAELTTWDEVFRDLRNFIEQRLQPPVVLMGHSFGANLSLWLAADYPQLVRALVLLDPIIPFRRSEVWPEGAHSEDRYAQSLRRRDKWPNKQEAAAHLRERGGFSGWQQDSFTLFLEHGLIYNEFAEILLTCPPWLEAALFRSRPASITWNWAERVQAPAFVLRGTETPVSQPEAHGDLAEVLPQGRLIAIDGGHNFAQENPGATGRTLSEALAPILGS